MPEILTESFCERCGTRYTFESVAPRKTRRLGQFKTLGKGMKNWVMSDDSSLDEAMAAARGDEEREVTAQQLDAFHSTFNFCMNCRQYTCANCWNVAEGRCLTCAPNLGQEILPAPFPDASQFEPIRLDAEAWPEADLPGLAAATSGTPSVLDPAAANGHDHHVHGNGFATELAAEADTDGNGFHDELDGGDDLSDLPDFDASARLAFLAGEPLEADGAAAGVDASLAEPEAAVAEAAPVEAAAAEPSVEPEPVWAAEPADAALDEQAAVIAEPAHAGDSPVVADLPDDVEGRAAAGAVRTTDLLSRFRPGQNIDAELAAFEAQLDAHEAAPVEDAAPQPSVEPIAAASPTAEPDAAPEPEPIAAEATPEPVPAEALPEPVAAEAAAPSEAAPAEGPRPREDVVEQPTWRIFAPDQNAPAVDPPTVQVPVVPGPEPLQASAAPEWPARPEFTESPSMALLANRSRQSSDALWAASSRELLSTASGPAASAPAGVQPCSSCGLSLSANARFCRRCGTRQG